MNRNTNSLLLSLLALGLVWTSPASANDTAADLRAERDALKQQVAELQAKRTADVDAEIEAYLDRDTSWASEAQGGDGLDGVSIGAGLTAVNQNTVNLDDADGGNQSVVSGLIEVDFSFQVSENVNLFANLVGNTNGHLDGAIPATLASAFDGLGLDSTRGTRPLGGVQVREAGVNFMVATGDLEWTWTAGLIDPRNRYLNSAFSSDYRTGFLNNEFVDTSAINWATSAAGTNILGLNAMTAFGGEKQFALQFGFYGTAGQWFDNNQLYAEFHWKGEISGRAMNVKVLLVYDSLFTPSGSDDDINFGASWDWMATDTIGVFVQFALNTEDVNPVETSVNLGAVFMGIIGSRPDDEFGIAVGLLVYNPALFGADTDDEIHVEVYYKFVTADGMQFTPHVMFVSDPGAGGYNEDSLVVIGVRLHVPF